MLSGFEIEHLARYEQQYRENVVYPRVARRAQQETELWLLRRSQQGTAQGNGMGRWFGERLLRLGMRLGTVLQRPATPSI